MIINGVEITSVKIGPKHFPIEEVEGLVDDSRVLLGLILHTNVQIKLEKNQDPQSSLSVLFHEIVHGLNSVANIEMDERDTDILSNWLLDFVLNNRKLFLAIYGIEEMMTYLFRCRKCGENLEIKGPIGETPNPPASCPSCHGTVFVREYTALPVHFHGSGFYKTDKVLSEPTEDDLYQ